MLLDVDYASSLKDSDSYSMTQLMRYQSAIFRKGGEKYVPEVSGQTKRISSLGRKNLIMCIWPLNMNTDTNI